MISMGGNMSLKKPLRLVLASVLALSVNAFSSQAKNRIAVSDVDKIVLYEYNPATKTFDIVWESAVSGVGRTTGFLGIRDIALKDVDHDGKNDLVAIDQFGIFVWGKNGKYPLCYNLRSGSYHHFAFVLPMDLDQDGTFEFLTQRSWDYMNRKIEAWKLQDGEAVRLSEIELPGGASWSLRSGDCDNDKTEDILTSSNLIQVLGWGKGKGFIEKASFPNVSSLVDVVRCADVDGDGQNEIVASGNGGYFTIYKARRNRDERGSFEYPVIFQSEYLGGYTQGLQVADIDGDGMNEILVGAAPPPKSKQDNIFVFERRTGPGSGSPWLGRANSTFAKTFSMPLESSNIPGFVVGDADNDGRNEVIYNSRHVLKFSRDAEGRLQCLTLATLGERRSDSMAAIGPFGPEGMDEPQGQRIISQNLITDLKPGDRIESSTEYRFWAVLNSPWKDARNVRARLISHSDDVKVLQGEALVPQMEARKSVDTKGTPFIIRPEDLKEVKRFELELEITADGGYRLLQSFHLARNVQNRNVMLTVNPKFVIQSETLGMSAPRDIYQDLAVVHDFFADDDGDIWPPVEALTKYKNLFILADYLVGNDVQREKTRALFEAGKNLLFHGDGVLYVPASEVNELKPFLDMAVGFFKSRYVKGYEGEKAVKGKSGDPLSNGLAFALIDRETPGLAREFQNFPDVLEALPGATPFLFYPTGEVAAVRVQDKYKLVYLGFSLDDIQSPEAKKELVKRIMAWFDAK